jgi:hypothetical protein
MRNLPFANRKLTAPDSGNRSGRKGVNMSQATTITAAIISL